MPQLVPPPPFNEALESPAYKQFFELLRREANQPSVFSQATDPGTAGVPAGTWAVWKNTTSGLVKIWTNDSGVMKSVTLT